MVLDIIFLSLPMVILASQRSARVLVGFCGIVGVATIRTGNENQQSPIGRGSPPRWATTAGRRNTPLGRAGSARRASAQGFGRRINGRCSWIRLRTFTARFVMSKIIR